MIQRGCFEVILWGILNTFVLSQSGWSNFQTSEALYDFICELCKSVHWCIGENPLAFHSVMMPFHTRATVTCLPSLRQERGLLISRRDHFIHSFAPRGKSESLCISAFHTFGMEERIIVYDLRIRTYCGYGSHIFLYPFVLNFFCGEILSRSFEWLHQF